jgi:hypothetical protein
MDLPLVSSDSRPCGHSPFWLPHGYPASSMAPHEYSRGDEVDYSFVERTFSELKLIYRRFERPELLHF